MNRTAGCSGSLVAFVRSQQSSFSNGTGGTDTAAAEKDGRLGERHGVASSSLSRRLGGVVRGVLTASRPPRLPPMGPSNLRPGAAQHSVSRTPSPVRGSTSSASWETIPLNTGIIRPLDALSKQQQRKILRRLFCCCPTS
ncbi:uncharacterized protein LOC144097070 [Amblyomma americanum]